MPVPRHHFFFSRNCACPKLPGGVGNVDRQPHLASDRVAAGRVFGSRVAAEWTGHHSEKSSRP